MSAYMVNIFGFLSSVYILGIYLLIYLFAVFFRRNSEKISLRMLTYHNRERFMELQSGAFTCHASVYF